MFFNHHKQLIRSKKSRIPAGAADSSDTIRNALYSEYDADFIDFIEVSNWLNEWMNDYELHHY